MTKAVNGYSRWGRNMAYKVDCEKRYFVVPDNEDARIILHPPNDDHEYVLQQGSSEIIFRNASGLEALAAVIVAALQDVAGEPTKPVR